MKDLIVSSRVFLFFSVLLGLAYPLATTVVAQLAFPSQAGGSFIMKDGRAVGSRLLSQKFESPKYFWGRPSAVDFNPLPSGGSNLGPTSAALLKTVEERRAKLMAAHDGDATIPQDLLFASASGLDPDISPEAALYQAARVAKARGLEGAKVKAAIQANQSSRQFVLLGEPRVNVLELNLALDR